MPFYAVRAGKVPGVYATWDECNAQVRGVSGAIFKKFASREAAEAFVVEGAADAKPEATAGAGAKASDKAGDGGWLLRFDGGSRGNPGPAAGGAVLWKDGREAWRGGVFLGNQTNNHAEYRGLIHGLEAAVAWVRPHDGLRVEGDSQLVIRQVTGHYAVRNDGLIPLHARATRALAALHPAGTPPSSFRIAHIPRELNGEADAMANAVLDAEGK